MSPGLVGPRRKTLLFWVRLLRALVPRVLPISGGPVVDLQVGGLSIGALVGTGASCMLLQLDIFHKLAERAHRHRLLADAPALRGIFGESLDVRG